MKRITTTSLVTMLVAIVCLLVVSTVLAQGDGDLTPLSTGYDLSWWTVDGGGGTASGGSYTLMGTTGQPDVGTALTGGGYVLTGGFWASVVSDSNDIYLPIILKSTS